MTGLLLIPIACLSALAGLWLATKMSDRRYYHADAWTIPPVLTNYHVKLDTEELGKPAKWPGLDEESAQ